MSETSHIIVLLIGLAIIVVLLIRHQHRKKVMSDFLDIIEEITSVSRVFNDMNVRDPLVQLVEFYNSVSAIHDKMGHIYEVRERLIEFDRKQFSNSIEIIDLYIEFINKNGRQEKGINRSKTGEQVTDNHVYLGDEYGQNMFSISAWKDGSAKPGHSLSFDFNQDPIMVIIQEAMRIFNESRIEWVKVIQTIGRKAKAYNA